MSKCNTFALVSLCLNSCVTYIPFLSKNDRLMTGEVLLNQNEESMALLVSAHAQSSVSNLILKYYLKSLVWLASFPL